jgi:hypothetical protein
MEKKAKAVSTLLQKFKSGKAKASDIMATKRWMDDTL